MIPGPGRSPGEGIGHPLQNSWASLVAQTVKKLSAIRGTWVQSLGWDDPLEEGMATHSSILAWKIPMDSSTPGFSVHGDSLGKNTEVGCHDFLQGIVPTQGLNPGLPHCRRILYQLCHQLVRVWRNAITQPHVQLIGKDPDAGQD